VTAIEQLKGKMDDALQEWDYFFHDDL